MYDREQMKTELGKLSWATVIKLLDENTTTSADIYDRFVDDVIRTGCLIKKHATQGQRKARDKFKGKLRALIVERCTTELVNFLDVHIQECERIEEAFNTILASVTVCDISKRSIQEQVWAVVERTVAELALIHQRVGEYVVKSAGGDGFAFLSPLNVRIKDERGELVNPDALVNTLIVTMGSSIKLLAHEGNLLDAKRIVLPPYIAVAEVTETEAIAHHYFANAWELVEEGSEHIRYWAEELLVENNGVAPEEEGYQELFRFNMDLTSEVFFRTARIRLEQQLLQNSMKLQSLAKLDLADPLKEDVSFSPNTFVSQEEADALLALSAVYNYPIQTSSKTYGGLSFREWIRAYAVLQRCFAQTNEGKPVMQLTQVDRAVLKSTLVRASLTPEKADKFIFALTFSLDKLDIYDAPLLEDTTGQLYFFAPAYAGISLPKVILSQFSSQEIQVYGKGETFEKEVRRMFKAVKIPVAGFKYWIAKQQFDCDAAVLWDDQLFIFECKNYGLPTGRASDDYFFMKKLEEAADQLRRIGRQLVENPDILEEHLGKAVHWTAVHLVLLNAMPMSMAGKIDGVFFYDASALGKLLREREINILIDPSGSQGETQRFPTLSLWEGDTPKADDLLKQLDDPIQLKFVQGKLSKKWQYERKR